MSLITRCPACSTLFKVVPDQLRVSDGWVRCGQCDEVFDANANLHHEMSGLQVAAAPAQELHEALESGNRPAVDSPEERRGLEPPIKPEIQPLDTPALPSGGPDASGPVTNRPHDDFLEKSPQELSRLESNLEDLSVMFREPSGAREVEGLANASSQATPPRYVQSAAPLQADSDGIMLTFLRSPASISAWHRPWVRAVLSAVSLLLVVAMLVQVVVHYRDRIVAQEPGAKEFVQWVCQGLGCRIEPLRQIDSIVIDNSSFAKVRADVYRLTVTLKNVALIAVAIPGLELTLTDMQDQSMVRKVFLAADFGATPESLEAGAEFSMTVPVAIKGAGNVDRISGYRLLAFYP